MPPAPAPRADATTAYLRRLNWVLLAVILVLIGYLLAARSPGRGLARPAVAQVCCKFGTKIDGYIVDIR